jgi:hypothetical protein
LRRVSWHRRRPELQYDYLGTDFGLGDLGHAPMVENALWAYANARNGRACNCQRSSRKLAEFRPSKIT